MLSVLTVVGSWLAGISSWPAVPRAQAPQGLEAKAIEQLRSTGIVIPFHHRSLACVGLEARDSPAPRLLA